MFLRVNLDTKLKKRGIISLLTDFGTRDAYVGAMKGVLLGLAPLSTLVDISHAVTKHNILQGAFLLSQVSSYFPVGSVHLAVIDPGVGTSRRRVIIQGRRCFYVGPDNGVLSLAVKKEGIVKIINIENEKYLLPTLPEHSREEISLLLLPLILLMGLVLKSLDQK